MPSPPFSTQTALAGGFYGWLEKAAVPARWRPNYWLAAAAPGLALYMFEALQISAFETVRAPNVTMVAQLALMLGFFLLWAVVVRAIWRIFGETSDGLSPKPGALLRSLGLFGLFASLIHLSLLALILRVMHSPPGWGPSHLLQSIGETWLGYAGFWILLYVLSCAVVTAVRANRTPIAADRRIEVRHGRNIMMLKAADIIWAEAAGNYVEIQTATGRFTKRGTLTQIEKSIGPKLLRSHRAALVNTDHIHAIRTNEDNGYGLMLSNGDIAPLSRRKLREARAVLRAD